MTFSPAVMVGAAEPFPFTERGRASLLLPTLPFVRRRPVLTGEAVSPTLNVVASIDGFR